MHHPDRPPFARTVRRIGLVLLLAGLAAGCNRQHYRQRADKDVEGVITQKNVFPEWGVKNWYVYPHPDARFADPSNPDRPPYPPDDYAARVLSPNPQHPTKRSGTGRFEGKGYLEHLATWDAMNRAADAAKAPPVPPATEAAPEKLPAPKAVEPAGYLDAPDLGERYPSAKNRPADAGRSPEASPAPVAVPSVQPKVETPEWKPAGAPREKGLGLMAVAGEIDQGGKTVPAVVFIPTAQQPDAPPVPPAGRPAAPPKADRSPNPKADAPAKGDGAVGFAVTGEAAASALKILETQQQGYRITLDQTIQLGLVNAREFQDRREDLYLAALPVTLERFSFAAQGFFTEQAAFSWAGRLTGAATKDAGNFATQAGFSKLFPTGALLAVKLANQVVVDLTGDRPTTTLSNFSLSLAQPFLRGGGYAVTLEPLTQAERNMVYAVRSYARFRKLFYVALAAGGGYTNNPYGLQGLSVNLGRGVGNNLTAPSVGYLQLVLQNAIIANQKSNVERLEGYLRLYEAFREGGQQSDLQVGQVEIQLLNSRNQLIGNFNAGANSGQGVGGAGNGLRGYLDSLDQFKLQLGLPMTVGLDLDASPLAPMREQLARFEAVYADLQAVEAAARQADLNAPVAEVRARARRLLTESALAKGTDFAAALPNRWAGWERLTPDEVGKKLAGLAEERRKVLDRRADRLAKQLPEPESETLRLAELEADLDLGGFEQAVRAYEARGWLNLPPAGRPAAQAAALRDVFNGFYQLALAARNERLARVRRAWPKLPGVEVDGVDLVTAPMDESYTATMQVALSHRLDLMNARGLVVDAWRQIKVTANALRGVLNVQYNLGSATPAGGANPFAFSGATTTNNLTINAQLPLVRRAERNNYRAALIGYQRQRRTLQAFEDNIANDVRADVRELRTIAELYRVQQRLVELGYSQVDNAQAVLLAPPAPGAQNDAGSAAALTNQLLQAQGNLVQAQNTLYTIWLNYQISRLALFADTEILQIDESGGWNDERTPGSENPDAPGPGGPAGPGPERLPRPVPAAAAARR